MTSTKINTIHMTGHTTAHNCFNRIFI